MRVGGRYRSLQKKTPLSSGLGKERLLRANGVLTYMTLRQCYGDMVSPFQFSGKG